MLPRLLAGLLLLPLLAGCASPQSDTAGAAFAATATTGVIHGVVVDERIVPIVDATIHLTGNQANQSAASDAEGRFAFGGLAPGTYFLAATSLVHDAAQTSVTVVAGDPEPPVTSLQLSRRFQQDPYVEAWKYDGFIQCGYDLTFMSSVCVNDYTHFVGPYTCTECEHLFDRRSTNFEASAGWQTLVFEMTWIPTAQGTSPEMRGVVSHFPRSASHWYCSAAGADPVTIRIDIGVACDDQQDEPALIPAEGLPNLHFFAAVNAAEDSFAAVGVSQQFSVYGHHFYYGSAPADWSFIRGDPFPF